MISSCSMILPAGARGEEWMMIAPHSVANRRTISIDVTPCAEELTPVVPLMRT